MEKNIRDDSFAFFNHTTTYCARYVCDSKISCFFNRKRLTSIAGTKIEKFAYSIRYDVLIQGHRIELLQVTIPITMPTTESDTRLTPLGIRLKINPQKLKHFNFYVKVKKNTFNPVITFLGL